MIWPQGRLKSPPRAAALSGYHLRTDRPGDEPRFFELMALAGWPGWDAARLQPWLLRTVPGGWFMAVHAGSGEIAASCMALHDHTWLRPFCGELGWLACDPAHRGQGLGLALAAAVTRRFIQIGYRHIHLYTEHYRPAAIKTYLKLGYIPYLYAPGMAELWQEVCARLDLPFTPQAWASAPDG
jgi:mycothiol synthase